MNLVCRSIFALLAFYIVYSECIKLPEIVKKNKTLFYFLIGGLYLYMYQNDPVEGFSGKTVGFWVLLGTGVFVALGGLLSGETGLLFAGSGLLLQSLSTITDGNRKYGWLPLIWCCGIGAGIKSFVEGENRALGGLFVLLVVLTAVGWPGGVMGLMNFL